MVIMGFLAATLKNAIETVQATWISFRQLCNKQQATEFGVRSCAKFPNAHEHQYHQ
jgi:hypothetical protein